MRLRRSFDAAIPTCRLRDVAQTAVEHRIAPGILDPGPVGPLLPQVVGIVQLDYIVLSLLQSVVVECVDAQAQAQGVARGRCAHPDPADTRLAGVAPALRILVFGIRLISVRVSGFIYMYKTKDSRVQRYPRFELFEAAAMRLASRGLGDSRMPRSPSSEVKGTWSRSLLEGAHGPPRLRPPSRPPLRVTSTLDRSYHFVVTVLARGTQESIETQVSDSYKLSLWQCRLGADARVSRSRHDRHQARQANRRPGPASPRRSGHPPDARYLKDACSKYHKLTRSRCSV